MADRPVAGGSHGPDRAHEGHDPDDIVALLDRDLPVTERAAAVALAEACASCRALLDDLRSISTATAVLPTPPRPRDFALDRAMATSIRPAAVGEPSPVEARLTREMAPSTPGHEAHDRLLIASLVDRSISEPERARAEAQLHACMACVELRDELVALSEATRALPVPARPRDFTLTPADADRLRVRGWRRLIAAIGSSRDVFSRPLAIGFTTLGLAGLLVSSVPMPFGGPTADQALRPVGVPTEDASGGSATGQEFATQASEAPPAPDASGPAIAAAGPSAAPSAASEAAPAASAEALAPDVLFEGGESSPLPGEPDVSRTLAQDLYGDDEAFAPSPMFVVAGVLLVIGVGLFALRWTARRLGNG